jgi:glycosyltransferase involved in cell wall biosynthesis
MLHWDTLMLGHFSIDTERWAPPENRAPRAPDQPLRVLHAPNHRAIKGSQFFIEAIAELQTEGVPIELVLLEKVPNEKVRETMADVDIVADQLIIGWYAMFALEAMAMQKPILCYLRPDLEELYLNAGLIQPGEIPILRCTPQNVKEVLRSLAQQPAPIDEIGRLSRKFVLKHHSLQAVGREFDRINRSIGIKPGAG